MRTNFSRREFLRRLAVGGMGLTGSWWLSACGGQSLPGPDAATAPTSQPPTLTHSLAPTPNSALPTPTPSGAHPTVPAASAEHPYLAVARGADPEQLVRQALAALGGMERFVSPGNDVIVKPNICVAYHTYEYAATTNPWVVGALVRLAIEAGARRVRVMDSPFGGTPEEAYARSGIQEQVLAAGGEMEIMSGIKFTKTDIPQAVDLKACSIYADVLNADVLIDVPVAKHHSLARLTLGMKNLMGVIRDRPAIHRNLGQRLADLTSRVQPTLTVIDAVRVLMDHGPTGGNLDDVKQLDTVIASADVVAADSYAAGLFGLRPDDLGYIQAGVAMGLGRSDLSSVKIEEINVG